MGSVVSVIVTMLLLLNFLDEPFQSGVGGLKPVAMERAELLINQQLGVIGGDVTIPCGAEGTPADVTADPAPEVERPGRDWIEIVATVLLALAAVATAWSSYQANRWNGEASKASGRVNALRIDAARAQGLAEGQTQVDIAMFFQWVNATATEEGDLADFYLERYRPEFRPAFDAWMATDPLENPDAPATPFAMPEYQLEARTESEALDAEAAATAQIVLRNIQRSANYVLGVVLFAVALFFAGMSTKLRSAGPRTVLLGVGCIVVIATAAWIASFPISVSV